MPRDRMAIEQILNLLAEHPPQLAELTEGFSEAQLHTGPGEGEWSDNDVLAHLRACADMWGSRIEAMLAQDRPTIRAINPRQWIRQTDYPQLDFGPSLAAFSEQRADLLKTLNSLLPKDWQRSAKITGAGKAFEQTLHYYAEGLATHERAHLKQLNNILMSLR